MHLNKLLLPILISALITVFSCTPDSADEVRTIMTVNGPINASEMDTTLVHEHVMVDWIGADSTGYHRWNREEVVERVLPYLLEVKELGLNTFFELTPAYLGRDPFILAELSDQSGLNVVTNTGFYGAVDDRFMPQLAYENSADEIAQIWIDEFENGIEGSDIRPGFMKISVGSEQPLSDLHQKIVDAAIKTHLETGLTITSHTIGDVPALEQVERIISNGVSPTAWVWTHAHSGTLDGNLEAAGEGAWISLDYVNADAEENGNIDWYVSRISELKQAGYLNQVLISHDAGWYDAGTENGGDFRGYTDIFDSLVPALKESGFSDEDIKQLLIRNPQEAYGIRVRRTEG
ncbi:MAG: phosphotriesterase [Bacteroidetes bacterium]|jgi:phosphotriesterase-related protein|nr:phosphotriesterase [Bacteroidota bacterium]